ncbi:hypothetical protein ACJX0J_027128, partial [Zea mays]
MGHINIQIWLVNMQKWWMCGCIDVPTTLLVGANISINMFLILAFQSHYVRSVVIDFPILIFGSLNRLEATSMKHTNIWECHTLQMKQSDVRLTSLILLHARICINMLNKDALL